MDKKVKFPSDTWQHDALVGWVDRLNRQYTARRAYWKSQSRHDLWLRAVYKQPIEPPVTIRDLVVKRPSNRFITVVRPGNNEAIHRIYRDERSARAAANRLTRAGVIGPDHGLNGPDIDAQPGDPDDGIERFPGGRPTGHRYVALYVGATPDHSLRDLFGWS